jgi:hypothetical protein
MRFLCPFAAIIFGSGSAALRSFAATSSAAKIQRLSVSAFPKNLCPSVTLSIN